MKKSKPQTNMVHETAARASANSESSALHAYLGVTPEQVDKELREQGIDPALEAASLRRMGRVLTAQFAPQAEREYVRASPMSKQFPRYEEAVAAGIPAWAGAAECERESSILDIVKQSDPATTLWAPVSGWSMRDAGINHGDMVLVDTKREARDGDIVVAHIAGEGQVVKRIRMAKGSPTVLESANPDFAPRTIDDPLSLRVHGVVIGRAGKI